MVANWWLKSHPKTKTLDGAKWLMGFYGRLKEDNLHPLDREYLEELTAWHKEQESIDSE